VDWAQIAGLGVCSVCALVDLARRLGREVAICSKSERREHLVAAFTGRRRLHQFDGADLLRERKISIDWMFSRDPGTVAPEPGKRDMRPKGPLVGLLKRGKQHGVQSRQPRRSRAFGPQKARAFRLRTVSDAPKFQGKVATFIGDTAKLGDGNGYRNLVPWRHESEMNVGGSYEANRKLLQFLCRFGKVVSGRGRHLKGDKNPYRLRIACRCQAKARLCFSRVQS